MGRFASQDPVFWELGRTKRANEFLMDPQQFNAYSFGRNNPVRFVDPTGEIALAIPVVAAILEAVATNGTLATVSAYVGTALSGVAVGWGISKVADSVSASDSRTLLRTGTSAQPSVANPKPPTPAVSSPNICTSQPINYSPVQVPYYGNPVYDYYPYYIPGGYSPAISGPMSTAASDSKVTWKDWKAGTADKREFKKPKAWVSGKEGAKDIPSWANWERPFVGENWKEFADRVIRKRYGDRSYDTWPKSDYNRLRKYWDRNFD